MSQKWKEMQESQNLSQGVIDLVNELNKEDLSNDAIDGYLNAIADVRKMITEQENETTFTVTG